MLGSENIVNLYNKVLDDDILLYNISEKAIRTGVISMAKVYSPVNGKALKRSVVADFNDVAHRCAYLHKYASLHTAMVRDLMFSAIRQNYNFFYDLLFSESPFKMCSLGGGPGSDVVGVLASLMDTFNYHHDLHFSVTIMDYMAEWSKSFNSIMEELSSGNYGNFGPKAGQFLDWRYIGTNLLKSLDPDVKKEISSASLITAIKFISATSCKDTEFMVKNIFSAMKPGAVLLFIDNDGGGFREFIVDAAIKYNFIPIYGPIQRINYVNEVVKVKRFGFTSCHKTRISVAVLQKPYEMQPRLRVTVPSSYDNSFPGSGYCRKVDENCYSNSSSYTPIPDTPLAACEVKQEDDHASGPVPYTPLTPYVFQLDKAFTPDPGDIAGSALCSDNGRHLVFTPDTPRPDRNRIRVKNGCLPLSKLSHWRHHLSTKLDSFKSHIRKKMHKNGKKLSNLDSRQSICSITCR